MVAASAGQAPPPQQGSTILPRLATFAGYLYMMRIPLLTWLAMLGLSGFGAPGGSILPGIFDIAHYGTTPLEVFQAFLAFLIVTLASLLAFAAVAITARLVVYNAKARFGMPPVTMTPGIELLFRVVPLPPAILICVAAFRQSNADPVWKFLGIAAGAVLFWLLIGVAQNWLWARYVTKDVKGYRTERTLFALSAAGYVVALLVKRYASSHGDFTIAENARAWQIGLAFFGAPFLILAWRGRKFVDFVRDGKWIRGDRSGYYSGNFVQDRHVFALFQGLLSLWVYSLYFALKFSDFNNGEPEVPTLSLILLMLALFCWVLAGVAFFFDYYRVPLLLLIVGYAYLVSPFQRGDHFYRSLAGQIGSAPSPHQVLQMAGVEPVILVAATGGGIQAAAWAARVLVGLAEDPGIRPGAFENHIRLISSVSGGSVGSMMFAADFDHGYLNFHGPNSTDPCVRAPNQLTPLVPELDCDPVVLAAERSSLDEVAWGLAYPDLIFGLFPVFKLDSLLLVDRGSALEDTWGSAHSVNQRLNTARLSDWRRRALAEEMPAVIFNSTFVETGQRLLLSTTDFDVDAGEKQTGRVEFSKKYEDYDLRMVTAARLSATFPFVSPAARILKKEGVADPEYHAVDGGYYDNYGMATLLEWLAQGIRKNGGKTPPILIVEIRSSSTETTAAKPGAAGWTFQTFNPLLTLWNVRGAGQLSHNVFDYDELSAEYPSVRHAVFEFSSQDQCGCHREDPLNWHLTPDDIDALRSGWMDPGLDNQRQIVRDFLKANLPAPEAGK